MAKDPAFLFYPNDYLGGTMGFTMEQHGMYILMIMYQFNAGPFTYDAAQSVCQNRFDLISHKFPLNSDGLHMNVRLHDEIQKRKAYSSSRRKNAQKNQKPKHMLSICEAHAEHMEDEDENRNIDKDAVGNESEKETLNTNIPPQKPADPWRTDHAEYVRLFREAADELRSDAAYCTEIERIYTGIDVSKSLDASLLYWTLESTWKSQCRKKVKTIRPKEALRANLSKSKVWYPRGSQPPPSIPYASSAGKPYRPQEY